MIIFLSQSFSASSAPSCINNETCKRGLNPTGEAIFSIFVQLAEQSSEAIE